MKPTLTADTPLGGVATQAIDLFLKYRDADGTEEAAREHVIRVIGEYDRTLKLARRLPGLQSSEEDHQRFELEYDLHESLTKCWAVAEVMRQLEGVDPNSGVDLREGTLAGLSYILQDECHFIQTELWKHGVHIEGPVFDVPRECAATGEEEEAQT